MKYNKFLEELEQIDSDHKNFSIETPLRDDAFEISDDSRNIMIENSKLNKLDDKLSIKYAANSSFLNDILDFEKKLNDILILSDIEGAEFEIFNDDNLSKLKNCNLIN